MLSHQLRQVIHEPSITAFYYQLWLLSALIQLKMRRMTLKLVINMTSAVYAFLPKKCYKNQMARNEDVYITIRHEPAKKRWKECGGTDELVTN